MQQGTKQRSCCHEVEYKGKENIMYIYVMWCSGGKWVQSTGHGSVDFMLGTAVAFYRVGQGKSPSQ